MVSKKLSALLLFLGAVHQVTSHIEMINPPPRKSQYNKNYSESEFDYSYTSPLGTDYPYPCRGYIKENISVQLRGTATHDGGHCQFSVSYNDRDWVVLKGVYGNCLTGGLSYDIPILANAPSGSVTFAWGWINRSGNREYYMNCADITIKNAIANVGGHEVFPEGFADDSKERRTISISLRD
ncbi:hypothetical protein K502DRAFT_336119 [Neoconidiobolus thromboides FSU 785]|nr:hypothetical protein K502DRAFT_336119 [Neoconidiobolus thromboides FSU 785]